MTLHRRATVPEGVHPVVATIFAEMARQEVTYDSLAKASGLQRGTILAWRRGNSPSLANLESACFSLGLSLVAVSS